MSKCISIIGILLLIGGILPTLFDINIDSTISGIMIFVGSIIAGASPIIVKIKENNDDK